MNSSSSSPLPAPGGSGLPEGVSFRVVDDESPDPSYLEQEGFEDRRSAYERGDFGYCGVIVERACGSCGKPEVIGSLWGIESDSGEEYFSQTALEIYKEEAR